MSRTSVHVLLAVALIVAAGLTLYAADKALPQGLTALFNGKDLTGWKAPRETTATGKW